jgi:hypothetical protein
VSSLFCRHNRFTADCSICSKGTVLDSGRGAERPRTRKSSGGGARRSTATPRSFSGPHVKAGPYEREGESYDVRLEKVPGGLRLAQWSGGALQRIAPELPAEDLAGLVLAAVEKELLDGADAERMRGALNGGAADGDYGASAGRAGDMREELRVEHRPEGRVRVGRWLFWPGRGWELQEAPPMYPAARYAEALVGAGLRPGERGPAGSGPDEA